EATTIVVSPRNSGSTFTLHFRLPQWAKREEVRLLVNGQPQVVEISNNYILLRRAWNKGDAVKLEMPMHLRTVSLPDNSTNYSILYGPIVLASRLGTQEQIGLFADD
ncbi:MAG: glycoside hydrolase family 127 protein, partial [Bacteroides sp.]